MPALLESVDFRVCRLKFILSGHYPTGHVGGPRVSGVGPRPGAAGSPRGERSKSGHWHFAAKRADDLADSEAARATVRVCSGPQVAGPSPSQRPPGVLGPLVNAHERRVAFF
jgi:hypothetical protein